MNTVLLAYSTVDGHTREISNRLAELLQASGYQTTLRAIEPAIPGEISGYDKYVVGASIRYGRYRPELRQFVNRHATTLNSRPSAFFSVNLVARKAGRDLPDTNPYIRKLLSGSPWHPDAIAVFAGKLDYARYSFRDRQIIRLIMWLTNGPVDPNTCRDYTSWGRVADFATRIAALPD